MWGGGGRAVDLREEMLEDIGEKGSGGEWEQDRGEDWGEWEKEEGY